MDAVKKDIEVVVRGRQRMVMEADDWLLETTGGSSPQEDVQILMYGRHAHEAV